MIFWRRVLYATLFVVALGVWLWPRKQPAEPVVLTATEQTAVSPDWFPLSWVPVKDGKRIGVRLHDSKAYFQLLEQVDSLDRELAEKAAQAHETERRAANPQLGNRPAREFPTFYDIARFPEANQGKLVTLEGRVRAVHEFKPREKSRYEKLYEVWMFAHGSQQIPTVVICSQVPEAFPRGEVDLPRVRVTGYFLKLYLYPTRGKFKNGKRKGQYAPLLLAMPPSQLPEPPAPAMPVWVWWVGGILVVISIIGLTWIALTDRKRREQRRTDRIRLNESLDSATRGQEPGG